MLFLVNATEIQILNILLKKQKKKNTNYYHTVIISDAKNVCYMNGLPLSEIEM